MAVTDRAQPYVDRLLEDRELQNDLRELASAARVGIQRVRAKRRKPRKLLDDRRFRQQTRRAAANLKDAGARFRGQPPKSHRGRRFVVIALVVGGTALALREMLKEPGPDAPWG
jgi:chemotaxis response regulator CheB